MIFSEKISLVAGGTRGIGFKIAKSLIDTGATCYITGRNRDDGLIAQKSLGEKCIFIESDATDERSVRSLLQSITTKHKHLHYAVNCIGISGKHKSVRETNFKEWKDVLNVNLFGPLLLMREEIKLIEKNPGGAIVNVSSCAGLLGVEKQSAYSTSKAALNMLTQVCALECAVDTASDRYSIRINAVCPGPTLGGMNSVEHLRNNPESTKRKTEVTAMKRFAEPKEVSSVVLFLLGEASSYITGTILPVDGGFSAGKF